MNIRERIMAALRREEPDLIPWTIYSLFLRKGGIERELRNMGLGLVELVLVYGINTPNVKLEERKDTAAWSLVERLFLATSKHGVHRTYRTPVGSVSGKVRIGYTECEWTSEHMLKDLPDYDVVKFMIEDTEYIPNYENFLEAERNIGEDGIVVADVPNSPLTSMLVDFMGHKKLFLDFFMHKDEFEDLHRVIYKKELEKYRTVADSPAEYVFCDEEVTSPVTSPNLFEKYCIPFYNEVARMLHRKGKIFGVHMDGRLKALTDLIKKTEIDVVEALTPPPIGDLSIEEARAAWNGKFIIWANFPSSIAIGLEKVEKYTIDLLRSVAPGDNFLLGVTENMPADLLPETLRIITKTVAKYGVYPITIS